MQSGEPRNPGTPKHMEMETSGRKHSTSVFGKENKTEKGEGELDHDTCYLAEERLEENGMKKSLRDKIVAFFSYLGLSSFL